MNLFAISGLINLIVSFIFGIMVFLKNRKSLVNSTFALLTLATAYWSLGYWRWLSITTDAQQALFWTRIFSIGSTLIPIFYFHWVLALLNLIKKKRWLLYIGYLITIIFLLFSFSQLFVEKVESLLFFPFWPVPGVLYHIYLIFSYFGLVGYSLYLLVKEYIDSRGIKRNQIRYVIFGSVIGFGGGLFNFFLWYKVPIPPYGNFLVSLYVIFIAYAITHYRLMDIRRIIKRSTVFVGLVVIIGAIFVTLSSLLISFFEIFFARGSQIVTALIVGMLVAIIFQPLKNFLEKITDKFLFAKEYDPSELLGKITKVTSSILNLEQLLASIGGVLAEAFHQDNLAIALLDKNKKLRLVYQEGFDQKTVSAFVLGKEKLLPKYFKHSREIQVIDELKARFEAGEYKPISTDLLYKFSELNVGLVIPLFVKEKLIGVVAIGNKKSGDPYSREDLNVINIIAGQSAVAIENAQLYDELKHFSEKLQDEVAKATKELKEANLQLKELDRAKSDFISIASHQLRTPLTIIKGYISMMLEGSFGQFPEIISQNLKKVYAANERLIGLVENLLDIQRIEAGKQQFNFRPADLIKLTQNLVENFKKPAQDKGLKLNFLKPKKVIPEITIDADKIHEVMMNFIDNAIKYTTKGKVEVSIQPQPEGFVTFCVEDSGMGISAKVMPNLFQKFSRGKGSFTVHTEGSGLGLFVAKMIIDAHGGKIWAESEGEDKGSKFCFSLPIKK